MADAGTSTWELSERALLAGILRNPALIDTVALEAEHFSLSRYGHIWAAASKMHREGRFIAPHTVITTLANTSFKDSPARQQQVAELVTALHAKAQECPVELAQEYAQQITQFATVRLLAKELPLLSELAQGNDLRVLEQIPELAAAVGSLRQKDNLRKWGDVVTETLDDIEMQQQGKNTPSIPCGLPSLDALQVFLPGELVILGARTSVGKSALALNIAAWAAKLGHVALFVSLEMRDKRLVRRVLATETGIPASKLKSGTLEDGDWKLLNDSGKEQSAWPIYILDRGRMDTAAIVGAARRIHAGNKKLGLIVVDYIQKVPMVTGRNRSRQEAIGELSAALKTLANDLDCTVLCLAQLNRGVDELEDRRPTLANLRESGDLEQDADTVLLLSPAMEGAKYAQWRTSDPRKVLMDVAKGRDGETMDIVLNFYPSQLRFGEPSARS